MGFFSDLKDDLSQAVNELSADDGNVSADPADSGTESGIDTTPISDLSNEELDAMLDKISEDENTPPAEEPAEINGDFVQEAPEPVKVEEPVFSMPTTSSNKVAADEVSTIMTSMIINGNMATEGSLEIMGSIVGNVEALGKLNITGTIQGNSSASEIFAEGAKITGDVKSMGPIKVGQSSVIIGNISATSAVIAGAVKGDIDVKGPVILDASAIVMGDIKSKSVQINNGAVIEGMCSQCYAEVNPTSFFEELKKMK